MKKIFIFLFVIISVSLSAQSYIWENNKEKTNEGNGWGRWIHSLTDIEITIRYNGQYSISLYGYGESHPEATIYLEYDKKANNYYLYKLTYHNTSKIKRSLSYVKSRHKLSDLAKGRSSNLSKFYYKDIYFIYVNGWGCAYRL